MSIRFTHVINPFGAESGSEHDIAQRVTFASLRRAVDDARSAGLGVEVLAAAYAEDAPAIEPPARAAANLYRSILDFVPAGRGSARRLPLLADILHAARAEGRGRYLIYTNVDIALQPHFYVEVNRMIGAAGEGCGFVINRRTIPGQYDNPAQLPHMYAEVGEAHPGYDCFVFPMARMDRLRLGAVCIGANWVGMTLLANLDALCGGFVVHKDLHLTFHIGDDRTWQDRPECTRHNLWEALAGIEQLYREVGAVDPGSLCHWVYQYLRRQHHDGSTLWNRARRRVYNIRRRLRSGIT